MGIHQSVEQFRDVLHKLNPTFEDFEQITDDSQADKSILALVLGLELEKYGDQDSLLYRASTKPIIKYQSGLPISDVKYNIVFAIGTNKENEPSTDTDFARARDDKFEDYNFYKEFFVRLPGTIKFSDCDDEDEDDGICMEHNDAAAYGYWCRTCCGQFYTGSLRYLLKKSIDFRSIPKNALYHIEEIVTPVDMTNNTTLTMVKKIMEADYKQLVDLKNSIDSTSDSIKKFIQEQLAKMTNETEHLNKMLADYGIGAIQALSEQINKIDQKIAENEKKTILAKLTEEHAIMKKKMAELEKQMLELGE